MSLSVSRRGALALLAGGVALPRARAAVAPATPQLALVSRHLQWTDAEHGVRLAREAGFPAILWTVRKGAHVEPAQVRTELPRLVRLAHAAGLATPMIITNIGDAGSDGATAILETMRGLGIRLYRAAAPRYRYDAPIAAQLAAFRRQLEALVRLNERYDCCAAFHTHSYADTIGGSAWDLLIAMRDLDPRYVGLNYDIGHVTAKGGNGWRESVRFVGPYLHSVSLKDFLWERQQTQPAGQWPWRTRFVQPGQGMVDFVDFFRYLRSIDYTGPLETYFEYAVPVSGRRQPVDLLGSDYGRWTLEMPAASFRDILKRDVGFYENLWREAGSTAPAPPSSIKAID